jgi:RNA polymerase sigma factor (sigma-70 family)
MLKRIFLSDKEIVRRVKANDRSILGDLYVTNERMIAGYIKNHGGGKSDIQDLLQEAIIVLWQNINAGRFEVKSKISTYLFAIAKNKWMAEMRRRKKLEYESAGLENKTDGNDSLDKIIEDEQKIRIGKALDGLNPPCKELLLLFYFEERSMDDIAGILNFANSNVAKAKKYQCKKALEALIKKG